MIYSYSLSPYELTFKEPAGTSRGIYKTRKVWFIKLFDASKPQVFGIGECAPLPNLSCDLTDNYESILKAECDYFCREGHLDTERLRPYPSILFGLETAILSLKATKENVLFDTSFTRSECGIPINGLVWMGSFTEMMQRLERKLDEGFRCIKLKIGAIDFEQELTLLKAIRERYASDVLEIRVDANGAFSWEVVQQRLDSLSQFSIHSIEQPIAPGNWQKMAQLCRNTPISIALDEELIGVNDLQSKEMLLQEINPQYIILKPSLHGGIAGSTEWIELAKQKGIKSWITSALESNIGLNVIAQFASYIYPKDQQMPQGLGTGQLYTNNIEMPLAIKKDELWFLKNS